MSISIEDYKFDDTRKNIPSGENSGISPEKLVTQLTEKAEFTTNKETSQGWDNPGFDEIESRDKTFDPQFVWRGKSNDRILSVDAPIIYKQETIYPRAILEDMKLRSKQRENASASQFTFEEAWGTFDPTITPGYYTHEVDWTNRMIVGDSLHVMASLAENESLRGKVQMIYMDPPYGIKFNSNWQPSTKSTSVADGKKEDITREPEMVKAFRDTWKDGIHSYLNYLRDRLIIARDLLKDSGSIFVQIGDENVHKVRCLLDEVFGEENFISQVSYATTSGLGNFFLSDVTNHLLWYARNKKTAKFRELLKKKVFGGEGASPYKKLELTSGRRLSIAEWEKETGRKFDFADIKELCCRVHALADITSQSGGESGRFPVCFQNKDYKITKGSWKTGRIGMERLRKANRIDKTDKRLGYIRYFDDNVTYPLTNIWTDIGSSFMAKFYVCQTSQSIIQRCMLMTTDPGDLVLDPTCGSGTTAYVAEQWGRRWITIDTSRVAIAIARRRLMSAVYPYYLLKDSEEGVKKEIELTQKHIAKQTYNRVNQGFVYERVPHITLKSIANNAEIDVIYDGYVDQLQALREAYGKAMGIPTPEEWEMPYESPANASHQAKEVLASFLSLRQKRQAEIDASIARSADFNYLVDKPYADKKKCRVTGPFTIESLSPVRSLAMGPDNEPVDEEANWRLRGDLDYGHGKDYITSMLEVLRKVGVKQNRKSDRIKFSSISSYAGQYICAEAYQEESDENKKSKRYAIVIGPEFNSITRYDIIQAAREAKEQGFDVLLVCAFNFEAWVEEGKEHRFGLPVLTARMNADLHMDLSTQENSNPFVIFGVPDIELSEPDAKGMYTIELHGVEVFDPKTSELRIDKVEDIDCWMIDTNYSGNAFFVRQIYFPGGATTFDGFKKMLKTEIDAEEWDAVVKTISLPFPKPTSGHIAVKVINRFGDEVMRIMRVE